jgi:thioredoxin-related protein
MKKQLIWKLATLALIVAVFAIAYQYVSTDGFTNGMKTKSLAELDKYTGMVVFTRQGCQYCEQMADTITQMNTAYPDEFTEYDASTREGEVEETMTKFKVGGFPTILLFKDGAPKEYSGARTKEEMGAAIEANRA